MGLGMPASIRWTINRRPAGVKRALAYDIEPHRGATNFYVQNT